MKWVKRISVAIIIILILAAIGMGILMRKAKYGFATYETDAHEISIDTDRPAILIFSKTTGWRHSEAIEAAVPAIKKICDQEDWFVYNTEDAGIFNKAQLEKFDVVIWNNSTGRVLTDEQRLIFQSYIEKGGGYLGIHGAGDFSHHWDWYKNELISAQFSHHPIKNQIQKADVYLSSTADSSWKTPPVWTHEDEWYIFDESPSKKGAEVLYFIDGSKIDPSGNMLWISDKDFGMGKEHPIAWTKTTGQGRSFYTSMGHTGATFDNKNMISMITEAITWTGKL